MHKPIKYVEKGFTYVAKGAWNVFDALNSVKPGQSFVPNWSEKPILKSWQKVKPPLGWPRETDSLCPNCVREARQEILDVGQRVEDREAVFLDRCNLVCLGYPEVAGQAPLRKNRDQHGSPRFHASGLVGPNLLLTYRPAGLKLTATALFGLFPEDPLCRLFVIAGWQF
mgnify:CR=1 FL=1